MSFDVNDQILSRKRQEIEERLSGVSREANSVDATFENMMVGLESKKTLLLEGIYEELKHMNDRKQHEN